MIYSMRYQLDKEKLRSLVVGKGYLHVSDFAKAHGINRATIHNYMKGKGGPLAEVIYAISDALGEDPLSLLIPVQGDKIRDLREIMPIAMKLANIDKEIAVGLLGSRAYGEGRRYSDWDLGLTRGRRPIGGVEFLRLKRSVAEDADRLPSEVDFVNLDAAPEWFLRNIDYEPLFLAGSANAWSYFLGVKDGAKKGE